MTLLNIMNEGWRVSVIVFSVTVSVKFLECLVLLYSVLQWYSFQCYSGTDYNVHC